MSSPTKQRRQIPTVDKINYEMLFAGKMRKFDKVTLWLSPTDGHEMISSVEIDRLALIVRNEILNNDEPLIVGEVHQMLSLYHLRRSHLAENNIINENERAEFKNWENTLSLDLSRKLKDHFRSLTLPVRKT